MKNPILFFFALILSSVTLMQSCQEVQTSPKDQTASKKHSLKLVKRFFTEVWNPPFRLETIDELVSEDFKLTTDGKSVAGRDNFKKWVVGIQSVVGDLKNAPQEMLVTDDGKRVITRILATGTNKGMFGTEADGAPIEFVVISIIEIEDGKITRNWVERSAYELYQRLTASAIEKENEG